MKSNENERETYDRPECTVMTFSTCAVLGTSPASMVSDDGTRGSGAPEKKDIWF